MQARMSLPAAPRAAARTVASLPARPSMARPSAPRRATVSVQAMVHNPPTLSKTKAAFLTNYSKPVSAMYDTVVQELLAQQHFMRYSVKYQYNEVHALGVVSVFDQILEAMPEEQRNSIFDAYISALGEDAATYRKDAAALEEAVSSMSAGDLTAEKVPALAKIVEKGDFFYCKFFAIGLFRMLELVGAKDPSALEGLVKSVGAPTEAVNKDLTQYKGILSRLASAKELMKEFLERERRKQAEREAEKKARAEKEAESEKASASA